VALSAACTKGTATANDSCAAVIAVVASVTAVTTDVSDATVVGIIVLATVAVAVSIFSCTEVTVGVSGTGVVIGVASGVGDWVVDGVPVDEDSLDDSVEPVEGADV
jgi:hypothetical protein